METAMDWTPIDQHDGSREPVDVWVERQDHEGGPVVGGRYANAVFLDGRWVSEYDDDLESREPPEAPEGRFAMAEAPPEPPRWRPWRRVTQFLRVTAPG